MSFEISEIIRVLQYTTYEEEGGDDPLNDMKKAMSLFDSNMGPALKWVNTPTESAGGLGEFLMGIIMWHWNVSSLYFRGRVVLVSEHN